VCYPLHHSAPPKAVTLKRLLEQIGQTESLIVSHRRFLHVLSLHVSVSTRTRDYRYSDVTQCNARIRWSGFTGVYYTSARCRGGSITRQKTSLIGNGPFPVDPLPTPFPSPPPPSDGACLRNLPRVRIARASSRPTRQVSFNESVLAVRGAIVRSVLSAVTGKPLWELILEQFDDLLVKILLLAAIISFVSMRCL